MSEFKKGDVVRLKSGGPKMTVWGPDEAAGGLLCQWFDGAKPARETFNEESLELANEGSSSVRELRRG
jgi:uncharacterized protein YodC (DUF2158 family)